MKILATRRLSQYLNVEKITVYKRRLAKVQKRLRELDHETSPLTTQRYLSRALWLEKRILKLQSLHRH